MSARTSENRAVVAVVVVALLLLVPWALGALGLGAAFFYLKDSPPAQSIIVDESYEETIDEKPDVAPSPAEPLAPGE